MRACVLTEGGMAFWNTVQWLFGTEASGLGFGQMVARAVVAYCLGGALVRLFRDMRLLGRYAAFDYVLATILGSTLSRGINGTSAFLQTLVAGCALVVVHALFSAVALRSARIAHLIKGDRIALLEAGEARQNNLAEVGMTERDLEEAIRLRVPVSDPGRLETLYLERNGGFGVVQRKSTPKVVEVAVEAGVKTIRIELG
jgi:uncharacterized membrane protein YcaP (DUF421 family)